MQNSMQFGFSTCVPAAVGSPLGSATKNLHPEIFAPTKGFKGTLEPLDIIRALKFGFANFYYRKILTLIVPAVSS